MAFFKKKADPISDRARALNEEIAALQEQIKSLDSRLQSQPAKPRLRSTAMPHSTLPPRLDTPVQTEPRPGPEPIFEEVDIERLRTQTETTTTAAHFNELGVRKYDLPALFRRIGNHFRGPAATNPKLVSYLAAGGIQGLRPLRYEKRVARNRFIVFVIFLLAMLLGLVAVFSHRF